MYFTTFNFISLLIISSIQREFYAINFKIKNTYAVSKQIFMYLLSNLIGWVTRCALLFPKKKKKILSCGVSVIKPELYFTTPWLYAIQFLYEMQCNAWNTLTTYTLSCFPDTYNYLKPVYWLNPLQHIRELPCKSIRFVFYILIITVIFLI